MTRSSIPVIYVTRKFPPIVGGMERLAADVATELSDRFDLELRALARRQTHLGWWLPASAAWLARRLRRVRRAVVIFGDPVVAVALRPFVSKRHATIVIVHGLDLTFQRAGYRGAVRRCLRRVDRIVAISRATGAVATELGIDPSRLAVINPGVDIPPDQARPRAALIERFGLGPSNVVLTTVGRLVPRKGVAWFVENVLPQLPGEVRYVVAGPARPEEIDDIERLADRCGVSDKVIMAGPVDEASRGLSLGGADVFVMPNLPQPGDMEGFGLVAAEAAVRGTVVVASRLEGIVDAVADGECGILCEPGDVHEWVETIRHLVGDRQLRTSQGDEFRTAARARFSSKRLGDEYQAVVDQVHRDVD